MEKRAKTFKEIYASVPGRAEREKTEKEVWVERMAEVTKKSPSTVRMWIGGRQVPDALTQSVLEKELGVPAEELFPPVAEGGVS